jgi:hypothetical protein
MEAITFKLVLPRGAAPAKAAGAAARQPRIIVSQLSSATTAVIKYATNCTTT